MEDFDVNTQGGSDDQNTGSQTQDEGTNQPRGYEYVHDDGERISLTNDHINGLTKFYLSNKDVLDEYNKSKSEFDEWRRSRQAQQQQPQVQQQRQPQQKIIEGYHRLPDGRVVPVSDFLNELHSVKDEFEKTREELSIEKADAKLTSFQREKGLKDEEMKKVLETMLEHRLASPEAAFRIAFFDDIQGKSEDQIRQSLMRFNPPQRNAPGKTSDQTMIEEMIAAGKSMSF